MDSMTPLVLAGAQYVTKADAVKDFHILWGARHTGASDHLSLAVLAKNSSGALRIERHNTTASTAWSGAMLGSALRLLAPRHVIDITDAESGEAAAGVDLEGHLRRTIDQEEIDQICDVVLSGEAGLYIVAVDRTGPDVQALLTNALRSVIVETRAGDLDAAFERAQATH